MNHNNIKIIVIYDATDKLSKQASYHSLHAHNKKKTIPTWKS